MKVLFCSQKYNIQTSKVNFYGINQFKEAPVALKNFCMTVHNPYTGRQCYQDVSVDLKKAQKIVLRNYRTTGLRDDALTLNYNPESYGYIKNKKTGEPVKTMILFSKDPYHEEEVGFHFLSEDLEKEYGYVHLSKRIRSSFYEKMMDGEILRDYPELGIEGPRVIVSYLKNWNDRLYGGVGKLADLMTVKYCKENDIKNIVSSADVGSHAAHFLRGKRFLPLVKNSEEYNILLSKYGMTDPNKILQHLLENSGDEKVNVSRWGLLGMYMPKEVFEKYAKQLNM